MTFCFIRILSFYGCSLGAGLFGALDFGTARSSPLLGAVLSLRFLSSARYFGHCSYTHLCNLLGLACFSDPFFGEIKIARRKDCEIPLGLVLVLVSRIWGYIEYVNHIRHSTFHDYFASSHIVGSDEVCYATAVSGSGIDSSDAGRMESELFADECLLPGRMDHHEGL